MTVAVMSAPLTSLSSNRKLCAWSSLSTSGICPPPLPLRPSSDAMDHRVLWEHPGVLGHGTGFLLFSLLPPPPPPQPLLPSHTRPLSRLPQAPATDSPTPAMGAPLWGKHPAVLPQTNNLKAKGTDWGLNPAPWGLVVGGTEGLGPPVWESLWPNSNQ